MSCSTFVNVPALPRRSGNLMVGRSIMTAQKPTKSVDVVIVGGGVAGVAAARALRAVGRQPIVFEQRQETEAAGQAIGLWTNAWNALHLLGVRADKLRSSFRAKEACIMRTDGSLIKKVRVSMFNGSPVEFRYVMRGDLVNCLQEGLGDNCVLSDRRVSSVKIGADANTVTLADGTAISANAVVGADGVNSVVRKSLGLQTGPSSVRYAGYRAYRGVARCTEKTLQLLKEGQILQVWGNGLRFGATLIDNHKVHWFITLAESEKDVKTDKRSSAEQLEDARKLMSHWEFDTPRHIVGLPQDEFVVTKCGDRLMVQDTWGKSAATLIGDACHLSTPNLGQGGALALEDAVELGHEIKCAGGQYASSVNLSRAFRSFEKRRWKRNLSIGVRSGAVGALVHFSVPPFPWIRNNILGPIMLSENLLVSSTNWTYPT